MYAFLYAKDQVGALFRDITERKKAEEALKESEARYRSLFSSIGEGFGLHEMLFDSQGVPTDYRFLEVNTGFEKQTGLRAGEILGKTVCEVLPDLEPFWIETYGKVVVTGEPVRFENYDRSLKRYFEVYAFRPVEGRFATIFTDVTERKKVEEALKANERMATIGQTAGMVGHDLRNPLQSIAGEVYLAKSELDSLPDGENKRCLQESIQTIEAQVGYMDKIVSDLQTFVKPVEAKMEIISLRPVITALLAQTDFPKNIQASMQIDDKLIVNAGTSF